jgi:pilus assembly protein FimV
VRKSKIKQISLAVCLALLPLSSYAAGLGKLNVNSGIGEPLKAEIELLSVTPEELSTLAASIASEDAYAQQGIPRLGIHNNIKVEIAKNSDGSPVLKIRSSQPVSDPYLDMLIQVDWATGRLQREYTVLLDPPGYKPESTASIPVTLPSTGSISNTQSATRASTSNLGDATQPVTQKTKKQKRPAQPVVQQEPVSEPVAKNDSELTTKRGDTLIAVAKEVQVEGVSLDQMLVGLYENNKEAFAKGNMNRLKVGQIIKVPSKEVLTSVDEQQAKKTIKIHSVNWNAYRNALAGNVEAAPAMAEAEQKQSTSGKIATAEDKAAPVVTGPKDVVKLSAGDKAGAKNAKDAAKSVEAKIIALQEETTARENSLKEANDKTAALEKQIADMQKLIAMKSQSMADMQKNAENTTKKPEAIAAPVEPVQAEVAPVVDAKPAELTPSPVEVPVVKPEVKKPVVSVPVVVPAPMVEEPGFLAGLMNSVDLAVLGGAGGVALLGAGWMFLRNKRRKDLDSFERGILTSGGLRANTVFGNTTGNASMSDTSFLTDFAQSADGSMIDTNDVDPIAEAEVYMAYGRDAQAEEILKDAISKEPKRYELHLKLLEMYAARKDTSAFEAIAGELYTTLGADDPTWAKVAAIGVEMEPSNPLYNLGKSVAVNPVTAQKLAASDFSDVAVAEDAGLDFSFNDEGSANSQAGEGDANSVVMQSFAEAETVDSDISFDLGTVDDAPDNNALGDLVEEAASAANTIAEVSSKDAESNLMDFDLGEFANTSAPVADEVVNEAPASEMIANTLEFNAPDIPNFVGSVDLPDSSELTDNPEELSTNFDMDFNLPTDTDGLTQESLVEPSSIEEISFDLDFPTEANAKPAEESLQMDASEISFDFPSIEEPIVAKDEAITESVELEANAFDLSDIDLNLADAESELLLEKPAPKKAADPLSGMAESPDVNIKLDLVAAYIDMDDKEGARELLEEILKEGGPIQQLRAKELLDSLA